MNLIGTRYATSKCHTLEDLQNLKSGGFRGEALSSLKEVSSVLMIESRATSSNETYCKIFTQGKSLNAKKSLNSRPSKGTTVTVYDFMYNMPVRKNSISEAIDFEECRKLLQSIALMHSNVSFTLKNEASGEMSLQVRKCSSLYHAFHQMFGQGKACSLKNVSYQNNEYEINGCISTDCHMSKELQFLYVNKRRVLRTKLHKLINSILNKALSSRQKPNFNSNNLTPDATSPSKNQSMCIFALNITCPYESYDIIFEPRKTMIEFSDWQVVLKLVDDSLIDFLKKEKLYSDVVESETSMLNVELGTNLKYSNMQDCKPGLFSNPVHRLPYVLKSTDPSNSLKNMIEENVETKGADDSVNTINDNQEFVLNFDKNISTSYKASSSVNLERNDSSTNLESSSCINVFNSNKSLIDNSKSIPEKTIAPNYFSTYSQETELGLPCRSVFPSKSPVMLRVPVKSTLSSLETCSSDSNFLKLKEKFQFLPRKERNYLSKDKKCAKKQSKVCLKVNNSTNTLTIKNNLIQSNLHPGFDKEKSRAKEHAMNLNHKSSQCPSISSNMFKREHHNNVSCSNEVIRSDSKLTKDKSLQCPSEEKARIVSSYRFEKESPKLLLQSFRKSSRLERKNMRKVSYNKSSPTTDDLLNLISDNNQIPQSKKLRSSSCTPNGNSDLESNSVTESTENNEMNIQDLHSVRPDLNLNNIYSDYKIDNIPENISIDSSPEAIVISVTKESKFTNLDHLEFSAFNLRTFRKAKNMKSSAESMDLSNELDVNHKCNKNRLLVDNLDLSSVDQVGKLKNIFSGDITDKKNELKCFDELSQERTDINSDCVFNSNCKSVVSETILLDLETPKQTSETMQLKCLEENDIVENTHLEHRTMKENKIDVNMFDVNSKFVSPYVNSIKDGLVSSNCNMSKEFSLFDLQNINIVNKEKIAVTLLESPPCVNFLQNQSEGNLEKTVSSHKFTAEDYDSCNLSGNEEKSSNNIDFVSDPFTEQLVSEPFTLKQNSTEKNDLDFSFPEFPNDPPFTELLNMDVEIYNNNQGSKNEISNVEVSESKFPSSSHPNDIDQNNCKNVIENEGSINYNDDACLDMDINTIPISAHSDVKDVDCKERNCNESGNCMHHWKLCAEPKFKRKFYIDPLTGNSAYASPKQQDVQAKQSIEIKNNNKIEAMLNEWDNPMFDIPYEAPSITENRSSQMYTFLNSYRFTKSTLSSLQVIGQVDSKFIACILQDFNGTSTGQRLLALFDQHAVHERIRLEELKKDLYETDKDGEKLVKTSIINPPLQLVFNEEEIRLLHTYHEKIQQIGIYMNIDSKPNICSVYSVPMCLVHKDSQELRRSLSDSVAILQNSIKEWLTSLLKTRCIPQVLPKSLLSVLNYQACRGAVKFGDPLSFEQCKDLLKSLSECSLPFQCAHGRPSVAPILDLKKIEVLFKKKSPPQLQSLHTNLQTFQICDT